MLPSSEIIVQFLKYQKLSLGIYLRFMSKNCVHLKDSTLLKHAPSQFRIRNEKRSCSLEDWLCTISSWWPLVSAAFRVQNQFIYFRRGWISFSGFNTLPRKRQRTRQTCRSKHLWATRLLLFRRDFRVGYMQNKKARKGTEAEKTFSFILKENERIECMLWS